MSLLESHSAIAAPALLVVSLATASLFALKLSFFRSAIDCEIASRKKKSKLSKSLIHNDA
ncbi:hypothetical protein [Paraburkholderia piptadeniae]|uniref:hypothetical protein n=1 Tax=Paraburkholderia piptadeniae TaxID=1701573 RepID=UPI00117CF8B8|nr:hypothetical protein [Paraburkholderia piptadeniae]